MKKAMKKVMMRVAVGAAVLVGALGLGAEEVPRPLIPFVAVTGKPSDADVERKVEELYEKSFQQFLIYPRTGLEYEYMGEEWLHLAEVFCRKAEKRGMKVWLYDEYNWPSGTCKGRVPRENEAWRYAELAVYRDEATGAFTWKKLWGPENWGNLCEEEGVKRFIELTHDKYQKRLGKYLKNKTIVGMFTDEPGTKGRVDATGQPWRFRWFSTMEEDYRARTGREFRKDVEACMSGKVAVQEYLADYAAVYGAKFRSAYFDQLRAKCDEMGIWLTGHLLYEQNPFWAIVNNGNPLEVLKGESLPGIDEIPTRLDPTPGKRMEWVTFATAQHAVSRNGNGGAVELFAYGPNDMRGAVMREMIWMCAFQGIDHYLLSLDVMDMRGLVKGGEAESYAAWLAPCQVGQPWTERAGVLNEEAARAARFARKRVELDVGVRYPQRLASYQEMDLDGVLREFGTHQVTVDLLAEDESSKLPYVFVLMADNHSLYEEVTKTTFANVAEAVKWVLGRVKKSTRLLEQDGRIARNVLSHVYEDGAAAFINLDLGGARRLVLERDGVRTPVELAPREVLAFEKGDVVEGAKERKCAAVGVKEFDIAFSQGAAVRISFGADGIGKIRAREDLKGVKFAVLNYWKVAASVEMDGRKIAADKACAILPEGYNQLYRETEAMDLAAGEHVFRIVSGKGDHNYFLPVLLLVGDVAAKDGEVWARGKSASVGSLKELGLDSGMGKMTYSAEVEVPDGAAGLRLATGGLFTEVKWNGESLGTLAWAPFEWALPRSAAGKGRLEITIYLPMVNMCGDENVKGAHWDSRFIVPPRSPEKQGLVEVPVWVLGTPNQ